MNYIINQTTGQLEYISFDLLLKKIDIEETNENECLIQKNFGLQYHCFVKTDILFEKIENLFDHLIKLESN